MIAETNAHPICRECKHAAWEGGDRYVCTKTQNVVTGYSPPAELVRTNEDLCGITAKWFEQRLTIKQIVDQAPIATYVKDDGSVHDKRTNQPIAENDKLKAFLPKDVNLDEWKRESE